MPLCPEMFELPIDDKTGASRWVLLGAQNRYFIGNFVGKTFTKVSGPHGTNHGAFYAAQTFSDLPDGRRIQIGWVTTNTFFEDFPDQIVNQSFSLPHAMTLRQTRDGLRVFFNPAKETEKLRGDVLAEGTDLKIAQANELLQKCQKELTEVEIEFADAGQKQIMINGIDASFEDRTARIFTDRTFNLGIVSRDEAEPTFVNIFAMPSPYQTLGRARLLPSQRCNGSAGASPSLVTYSLG